MDASTRLCLAVVAVATFIPGSASAQGEPKTHDGLYAHAGIGFGYFGVSSSGEVDNPLATDRESSASGTGLTYELLLGYSVTENLVLGVGYWGGRISSPSAQDVTSGVGSVAIEFDEVEFDDFARMSVGPFANYYFDPKAGLYLQAALGYARLSTTDGVSDAIQARYLYEQDATGFGLLVGAGYEWWVLDQFGVGVLGRVSLDFVSGETDDDVEWGHRVLSPALLLSVTYH